MDSFGGHVGLVQEDGECDVLVVDGVGWSYQRCGFLEFEDFTGGGSGLLRTFAAQGFKEAGWIKVLMGTKAAIGGRAGSTIGDLFEALCNRLVNYCIISINNCRTYRTND